MVHFGGAGLRRRRAAGAGLAGAVAAAVVLAGALVPTAATAAPGDQSASSSRFLSGSLLLGGIPLDDIVDLGGSSTSNAGSPTPDTETSSLDLTALNLLQIGVPGGLSVPFGDFMQLGAVNQYSQSSDAGVSRAATGAVSDSGVIDTTGTGAYPSNASFNLQGLLGSAVTGTVADLDISLEAISSEVAIDTAGTVTRDYNVAGGGLTMTLPAIATLQNTLTGPGGVAATVDAAVASLAGPDGLLAQALAGLNGALAPILGDSGVNITITTDIAAALNAILDAPVGDGVVTVNLRTGVVSADLNALFSDTTARGLNNLDIGEEVLSPEVLNNLITRVGNVLNTVPGLVQTALTNTLNAAVLNVDVAVCVVGTGPTCTVPVVDVGTGLQVSIPNQSLGSVVAGTASATISLKVAGLPVAIPVGTLLSALTTPINATLFGPTGVIATVVPTVTTAVTGIVSALAPAVGLVNGVVSLRGNVRTDNGPIFSQEAFVLTVGDLLGAGGVGTIVLARAQAGPNALADAPTVDAAATVQAGTDLAVSGAGWPADTEVSVQLTAPGGGANVGGPETVTTDGAGGFTLAYPVPAGTPAAAGYTVTATDGTSTALDTTEVTAAPATVDAAPTVQAGTDLAVSGAGWPADTEVSVQLTAPGGGANVGGPETVTTDGAGGFTLAYPVPADTPPAAGYTVTATAGAVTATDTTEVTAVVAAPTVDAADTVEAGSSLSVTGSGWPADAEVVVQLTAPGGGAPVGTPQTVTTTALGGFTLAYPVPAGTPAGTGYTVTATAGAQTATDTTAVTAAPVVLDAADTVPAGANLAVTGSGWPVNSTVSLQLTAPGGGADVGGPVSATTDAFGAFSTTYPVPAGTAPATGYTITGTSGAVSQTDTVEVTAGDPADVNTNAAASASASADATADGDPSAQAAAEAAALADATSAASAAATADASAAAVAAATTDASTTATADSTSTANASAAVAAQAAAQADASDDADAAASTAADANSAASSESAATADSSTDASAEASTNANAAASASASANADASTDAVAEAAAQAAAWADATAEGSAAANPAAEAAAQTSATATSSTDATADATSAANAGAAVAAQAAALADATSTTAAQASATSDASTSAASNASAAAIASASTDASSDAVGAADAAADPAAQVNTNASASAAASAQADSDANAVAEAAAVAAALADATSSASAAADVTADAAASAAATTDASTDASSTVTTDANASAAAAAQAAAQTDATSTSTADASAAATANADASSAATATASSSATASASAAADVSADATAAAAATATASATATAAATASADGNAAADPGSQIGIRVVTPVLQRGEQQTAIGTGFQPGETVTGVMSSEPLALGSRIADARGEVTFTWTIPANTDLGTHTVTLTGATSGAVSATFQVVATGLATTGGDVQTGWIALAALLLLMGLGAVRLGRRRTQTVAIDHEVD